MPEPIRWGILSTARIGRTVIRGIGRSRTNVVQAVASRDYSRALEWAKEHGIPRAFGSYDEMLGSGEIDAVYNPLPNSLHGEWTIRALEAGLPVLCEKPFTATAEEARRVAAVAQRTNTLVVEAFMYRYHPLYDRVEALLAEQAIGELVAINSTFTFALERPDDIRTSAALAGGALMDVGCYCVNLSRRVAGCEPARTHAFERRTTVDDTLLGSLEFPNGVVAQFECSMESHARQYAEIIGTKGMIEIPKPWYPGEERAQFILRQNGREETVRTEGADCFHLEIENFSRALRTRTPVRWPIEDAIANMAVIEALYTSARDGVVVGLEA